MTSNGQVNHRFNSGLDSSYLGMHVCNSFLEMVVVWMRRALRRSGVCFGAVCMAGIGNAVPVLAELQRICKRLLVPVV